MLTPAELRREIESMSEAIAHARVFFAGLDQADAARQLETPRFSPLRGLFEQAGKSAERVANHFDGLPQEPCIPSVSDLGTGGTQ